jgi:hypothetical protein
MRLIHAKTLQLQEFPGNAIPPYTIFSHTWGKEEVSFEEMQSGLGREKKGFKKIQYCCEQALKDGYEYAWVDTCCTIQTHHRRQCPTKRAASAAENGGSWYLAFKYQTR